MPSRIKVRVFAARDLPVMDQASKLTDAYVEIKLSDIFDEKTDIAPKTLNPVWNKDFRIEVPHDGTLRKHPLEFKIWDRDQFSKDDIIGIVFFDLNNLLLNKEASEIVGWFPIYDTFRGIRGELKVSVKLEFFGELTSAGVDDTTGIMFFSSRTVFHNLKLKDIQGFVEELIVDDDPEYNWKDNFRTARSSNEARQYLLYKLSGKLRRQIGNKVIELGGNAVLGFSIHFDFAETCIVARGYGTCCTLKPYRQKTEKAGASISSSVATLPEISPEDLKHEGQPQSEEGSEVAAKDSEENPIALNGPPSPKMKKDFAALKLHTDIQFLTIHSFPPPVLVRLSGIVTARSIKIIPKVRSEDLNRSIRDLWWSELRDEIRSHCRFLKCQFVLGYTETTTIRDDIIVLSATGTAANIKLPTKKSKVTNEAEVVHLYGRQKPCSFCHIPYDKDESPFPMRLVPCSVCGKKLVPEILLATIDPPPGIPIVGRGQLVEARVCRTKKKLQGEGHAVAVSELVPFLEYDLHKQLLYKLRLLGMNAVFGLKTQLCVGDSIVIAAIQGTAVCIPALPRPQPLKISSKSSDMVHLHSRLNQISVQNMKKLQSEPTEEYPSLHDRPGEPISGNDRVSGNLSTLLSSIQLAAEITNAIDATAATDVGIIEKPSYVVELDDKMDEDLVSLLVEPSIPKDYNICNTEILPGMRVSSLANMQFLCVMRSVEWPDTIPKDTTSDHYFSTIFTTLYGNLMFKCKEQLRNIRPLCVCGVNVEVQIGQDDDVQLVMTGMALMAKEQSKSLRDSNLGTPSKAEKGKEKKKKKDRDESSSDSDEDRRDKKSKGQRSPPERRRKNSGSSSSGDDRVVAPKPAKPRRIPTREKLGVSDKDSDDNKASSPRFVTSFLGASPKKKSIESVYEDIEKKDKKKSQYDSDEQDKKDKKPLRSSDDDTSTKRISKKKVESDSSSSSSEDSSTDSEEDKKEKRRKAKARARRKKQYRRKHDGDGGKHSKGGRVKSPRSTGDDSSSSESSSSDEDDHPFGISPGTVPEYLTPAKRGPVHQRRLLSDVEITPLSYVPGARITKFAGRVSLHFVKESFGIRELGGMNTFSHNLVLEAHKLARAHVSSMGGNCLTSYQIDQWIFMEKPSKNQGYILINLSGDAVCAEYDTPVQTGHERVARVALARKAGTDD